MVVLLVFMVLETRLTNPMMPMAVLKAPGLLSSSVVRGLMVVGMYSTFFIGVLYFQHVLAFNAVATGLAFLPQTLMVAVMSAGLTTRIIARIGAKTTSVAGMVIVTIGLGLFVLAGPHTSYFPQIFIAVLFIGFGAATAFTHQGREARTVGAVARLSPSLPLFHRD